MKALTAKQEVMLRRVAEAGTLRKANVGAGSAAVAQSLYRRGLVTLEEHHVIDTIFRLELTLTDAGRELADQQKAAEHGRPNT